MAYSKTLKLSLGLSGGEELRIYDIVPDSAQGSITISDVTKVYPVALLESIVDPKTGQVDGVNRTIGNQNSIFCKENSDNTNQVDFYLLSGGSEDATSFGVFRVTLKTVR